MDQSALRSEIPIIKHVLPIIVASITGEGNVAAMNSDLDQLYKYLYAHNLQDAINGPAMALFYTETGGKYIAAVPVKGAVQVPSPILVYELPAIKCLALTVNDDVDAGFGVLKYYQIKNGLDWYFPVREIYIPSTEPNTYLTEIQVPIQPTQ